MQRFDYAEAFGRNIGVISALEQRRVQNSRIAIAGKVRPAVVELGRRILRRLRKVAAIFPRGWTYAPETFYETNYGPNSEQAGNSSAANSRNAIVLKTHAPLDGLKNRAALAQIGKPVPKLSTHPQNPKERCHV